MAQEGTQRPPEDTESPSKISTGAEQAKQAPPIATEEGGKNPVVVEKLQESTGTVKDYFADKMDQVGAATKSAFTSDTDSSTKKTST